MTMKKKMAAYGFTALMVLSLLVAMAPTATAQDGGLSVTVSEKSGNDKTTIAPETETRELNMLATVTYPVASGCAALVKVTFTVSTPGTWAVAVPNPSTTSFTAEGDAGGTAVPGVSPGGGTKNVDFKVTITTTRQAPAFQPALYRITADVESAQQQGGCTYGSDTSSTDVTLQNGFFALIQTVPVQTLLKSGQNSQVRFPVDVTNFGNGETQIRAETTYNSKNQLDALIPPAPFILESKATSGQGARDQSQVFVTARTPSSNGYVNDVYAFQVDFSGEFAGTTPAGSEPPTNEQTIFLSLQVQGVYAPGFDPVFAIGALGIALIGLRRFAPRE